jgi:hypothetical protein
MSKVQVNGDNLNVSIDDFILLYGKVVGMESTSGLEFVHLLIFSVLAVNISLIFLGFGAMSFPPSHSRVYGS